MRSVVQRVGVVDGNAVKGGCAFSYHGVATMVALSDDPMAWRKEKCAKGRIRACAY